MAGPLLSWRKRVSILALLSLVFVGSIFSTQVTGPLGSLQRILIIVLLILQGGITVGMFLKPYTRFVGENIRPTQEPESSNFTLLCEENGAPINGVWNAKKIRNSSGPIKMYGVISAYRNLFVQDDFLDTFSPDEQRAAVIYEAALSDKYYYWLEKTLAYLVLLIYYAFVLAILYATRQQTSFQNWPLFPELGLVLFLVLGIWYSRQIVYRADCVAAERTDTETVINFLQKIIDEKRESGPERMRIKLLSALWTRPSPSKRIDRLSGKAD